MRKNSESSYSLEDGDVLFTYSPQARVKGPAKVELSVENGSLFATIDDKTKYELDGSKLSDFNSLVDRDSDSYLDTQKAKDEDKKNDDGLPWLTED